MAKLVAFLAAIVLLFCSMHNAVQAQLQSQNKRIDSLQHACDIDPSDTAKLRMLWQIGSNENIHRISFWDSIIRESHAIHCSIIEVRAMDSKGMAFRIGGNLKEAELCYISSIALAEKTGLIEESYSPIFNLSTLYSAQNNIKKSLEYCYKGLKLVEGLHRQQDILSSNCQLGSIYYKAGEINKSILVYQKALQIAKQFKYYDEYVDAAMGIGSDYFEFQNSDSIIKYYLLTRPYIELVQDPSLVGACYNSIGVTFKLRKMFDSAGFYYLKSYDFFKKLNFSNGMVSALSLLADNSQEKGDFKSAKEYALKAFEMANEVGFKGQIPALARTLKDIYAHEKNYKEALKYYELSVNARDSVNNEKNRRETLEKAFQYDLEKKENANQLLAQKNQIQSLSISNNRYLIVGLLFALLLLIIIFILIYRQSSVKAQQQKIMLEQKLLRSQMTPHFIFNSLQAIQNFMLKKEARMAAKYLSSFASLIRSVLENSGMENIRLDREIELLQNYLQLQKLRFGDRFEYRIIVSEEIQTSLIMIPPMLCQPFIENSIEHGLSGNAHGGEVIIDYKISNNMLLIEIIDNGIGIEHAGTKANDHRSLAVGITKERIELINKQEKRKTTFEIMHAFPQSTDRKGVKVRFSVPLQLAENTNS